MTTMSTARRAAWLNQLATALNSGTLEIRTGTQPASPDVAATGTLLVTFSLPATFAATTSSASVLANSINAAQAVATGTAGWGRLKQSGGTAEVDMPVVVGGDGIVLSDTSITSGVVLSIDSLRLTIP